MPGGITVHAVSCGTTFTIVLTKKSQQPPSPPLSVAATAASAYSLGSPGFSLEELQAGSNRKHEQKQIGRYDPSFITGIVFLLTCRSQLGGGS